MIIRPLVSVLFIVVAIAGCGGASASATPSVGSIPQPAATAGPARSAAPPAEPAASGSGSSGSASSGTASTGQTDTDWGRIWDSIPADFPRFVGSTTAEEGAAGPASATLAVASDDAKTVATWIAGQLKQAGYAVDGDSSALEDGSVVLDARRAPSCRVGVTVAPTGGITTVTVMYGAGCPNP